jgi:hypothetical protein
MIAVINGAIGSTIEIFKGTDGILQFALQSNGSQGPVGQVSRKGTPLDVTGDTITFDLFDDIRRKNVASVSLTGTIVTALAGLGTFAHSAAQTAALTGSTYYAFVKRTENTGTTTEYSDVYTTVLLK